MKGIGDESGRAVREQSRYFELRKGVTWSIQVQGEFTYFWILDFGVGRAIIWIIFLPILSYRENI